MENLKLCYEVLTRVYKDNAYSNLELNKALKDCSNTALLTKLTYGVLEKDIELDYYIDILCDRKPQLSIIILLKIAMYCIKYMDGMPDYAVVNKSVDLCEIIGKKQLKGFTNAVLKKFCSAQIMLPTEKIQNLSVKTSTPLWLVREYCEQYGFDKTSEFLNIKQWSLEHIRPNTRQISLESLQKMLESNSISYEKSQSGGLYVSNCKIIKDMFISGLITFQSETSMRCVQEMDIKSGDKVLDLCSAPGGKAVYASEIAKDVEVLAAELHPHRIELINAYCNRMKAHDIQVIQLDATKIFEDFVASFDKVLCDVPCSGFGIAGKKPDIYLQSSMDKVQELTKIQYAILSKASKYVKQNGVLVYSTCTLLKQENSDIISKFLKQNPRWELTQQLQYFPDNCGLDGFYIAKLTRVKA